MKHKNQIPIGILVVFNLYLCLPHNLILNAHEKIISMSEGRKFYLTYLVFYTKQTIKVQKDRRFHLVYLVAQKYKQAMKVLSDKRFRLA